MLVCGDRNWTDRRYLYTVLDELLDICQAVDEPLTIIEGEARGADTMAREWAESRDVPVLPFPAYWNRYGRGAGPIRNQQMLNEGKPHLVIAFHENFPESTGTRDMVNRARAADVDTINLP